MSYKNPTHPAATPPKDDQILSAEQLMQKYDALGIDDRMSLKGQGILREIETRSMLAQAQAATALVDYGYALALTAERIQTTLDAIEMAGRNKR